MHRGGPEFYWPSNYPRRLETYLREWNTVRNRLHENPTTNPATRSRTLGKDRGECHKNHMQQGTPRSRYLCAFHKSVTASVHRTMLIVLNKCGLGRPDPLVTICAGEELCMLNGSSCNSLLSHSFWVPDDSVRRPLHDTTRRGKLSADAHEEDIHVASGLATLVNTPV